MTTKKTTITFLEEQLGKLPIRIKPMFGDFGLYCSEKMVGLICDDTLFIKPSPADPKLLAGTVLAPAYPGSNEYHSVPAELIENADWLQAAIRATAAALPEPIPKPPKTAKKPAPKKR